MIGGGLEAAFVQENGTINPLPGSPRSEIRSGGADNDYYFAGEYNTTIPSVIADAGADYTPVGAVLVSEDAVERAFAGGDNDLRFHFNLPDTLKPTNQLSVSFEPISLDTSGGAPHYGIEVWVNGVKVQDLLDITPTGLFVDYTTPQFTLESVNAQVGPGYDNIVSLRGINYNADGGGNWMGFDYVRLNQNPPELTLPITVGIDDDGWPFNAQTPGNAGGANATFVQEAGSNNLPGNPDSRELDQRADDDYYLAGVYTNTIPGIVALYGDYVPTGVVSANEESAERAFAGTDNEKRYHFNLPSGLKPTNTLTVTYDMFNLDTSVANPHYGVEVYFNGNLLSPERIITSAELDTAFTTEPFTLESVGAQVGPGYDNIVTLKGVNHNGDTDPGGGWMGIDYVKIDAPSATPLKFSSTTVSNGKITISWTGSGTLEWAPAVGGPWNPVAPAPTGGTYTEDIVAGQNRFYRLRSP